MIAERSHAVVVSNRSQPGIARRCADGLAERSAVPAAVNNVVRAAGQPLDGSTRSFMESQFGHDFGNVRVHAEPSAADSARAVNAMAYTVGRHIVFGAQHYAPQTNSGRQLLAHELTHVVQQSGTAALDAPAVEVGPADDTFEREAHQLALSVASAGPERQPVGAASSWNSAASITEPPTARLQRNGEPIPVELVPVPDKENQELKKQGINLPTVSAATWRLIGGRADNANEPLAQPEIEKIKTILTTAGVTTGTAVAGTLSGTKFLLHDTSSPVGPTTIKHEADVGQGPLGKGVAAWVPRDAPATIARPDFFEQKRPSTTEFEKGMDIILEANREAAVKAVWAVTRAEEQDPALDRALAGTGLTADALTSIKTGAKNFFAGAAIKTLPDGSRSAAVWAVGELCAKARRDGTAAVAAAGKDADFDKQCQTLARYFSERGTRVGSIVPVEIVQVGAKAGVKGVINTCDPTNPDVEVMPKPPYSDNQFKNLVLLYLRAAFIAGRFPEITTHFVIDTFDKGHCDPRCFDLQKLYNSIALALGHGVGSTYGVKPAYGLKWGTHTIWWDNTICGGPPP